MQVPFSAAITTSISYVIYIHLQKIRSSIAILVYQACCILTMTTRTIWKYWISHVEVALDPTKDNGTYVVLDEEAGTGRQEYSGHPKVRRRNSSS